MANKCGACGRFASTIDSIKCASCTHLFHRKCASIPIDGRISNKWQCSGCKAKNVCASGVNTIATPSSCSSGGTDTEFGDAQLGSDDGGRCETNVDLANELKLIREQLTTIAREMVSFRQEITNINSNVSEISNRVSDVEKRIACLEQQATDLPNQPGGSKVEDSIAELKCRLNERDQELLLNDLEISGRPRSENEENDHIGEDHDQSQDKQPRSTASTESDQTTDNAKNSSKSEFKSPLPKKRKYVANQDPMLQSAFDLLKSSASAAKAVATASTAPATGLDQYQLYANFWQANLGVIPSKPT
ncbi:unnamed protein product [Parnassius apollo]|uniref:(apollo) hypothetical protein n=1 Tax=Parnassius apollo TaxID=110799 RepID=A0A8S3XEH3_PARAO|nr:unnamed protein product [Parnassius apollo]